MAVVIACCLTAQVLLAAKTPAAEPVGRDPRPALELEARLSATPAIYFVIDTEQRTFDIKSRGVVLDRIALTELAVVQDEHLWGSSGALELPLPAVLHVTYRSGVANREIIPPKSLEPFPEDGTEEDRPAAKRVSAKPPASYYVKLDNGWAIAFDSSLPGESFYQRFRSALDDAWLRFFDVDIRRPPTLALALAGADAERLHHLLRQGTAILVLPPAAAAIR